MKFSIPKTYNKRALEREAKKKFPNHRFKIKGEKFILISGDGGPVKKFFTGFQEIPDQSVPVAPTPEIEKKEENKQEKEEDESVTEKNQDLSLDQIMGLFAGKVKGIESGAKEQVDQAKKALQDFRKELDKTIADRIAAAKLQLDQKFVEANNEIDSKVSGVEKIKAGLQKQVDDKLNPITAKQKTQADRIAAVEKKLDTVEEKQIQAGKILSPEK